MDSALIAYHAGSGGDHKGRLIGRILGYDDYRIEHVHDFVQWLFPLPEPSAFNLEAPPLTAADIAELRQRPGLTRGMLQGFVQITSYFGFVADGDFVALAGLDLAARLDPALIVPALRCGPEIVRRAGQWATPYNHNFRRISRMLAALVWAGHPKVAQAFHQALTDMPAEASRHIDEHVRGYWARAVAVQPDLPA
ncbi:opioid growth factor receptor-related protein [Derxia lacustris]|uniref:opioid growth factor receptor-related protein n=1 Tax=Derxia lacustris TaxID=764842 RepID=UPI000A177F70|nr:opioid growth factor receptor-related protein [Derxia lacustris]